MAKNDPTRRDGLAVERLIKELQTGLRREESYERLFTYYYPPLRNFFLKRGVSSDQCKDLIQDTFLNAFQGIGRFQHGARFDTWLFAIAANVWKNALRSKSTQKRGAPEVELEPGLLKAGGSNPEQEALIAEREGLEQRALRQVLEELPPQMRRCLILRLDRGLKYREIAEILGVEINTVKSLLHEAKKRVKGNLADKFPELYSLERPGVKP